MACDAKPPSLASKCSFCCCCCCFFWGGGLGSRKHHITSLQKDTEYISQCRSLSAGCHRCASPSAEQHCEPGPGLGSTCPHSENHTLCKTQLSSFHPENHTFCETQLSSFHQARFKLSHSFSTQTASTLSLYRALLVIRCLNRETGTYSIYTQQIPC